MAIHFGHAVMLRMDVDSLRSRMSMTKSGWRDDRDVPEGMQHQQIEITGDDDIRPTIRRQFEKFVVGGIAAHRDPLGDRHQLGLGEYPPHFVQVGGQQLRREIGSL